MTSAGRWKSSRPLGMLKRRPGKSSRRPGKPTRPACSRRWMIAWRDWTPCAVDLESQRVLLEKERQQWESQLRDATAAQARESEQLAVREAELDARRRALEERAQRCGKRNRIEVHRRGRTGENRHSAQRVRPSIWRPSCGGPVSTLTRWSRKITPMRKSIQKTSPRTASPPKSRTSTSRLLSRRAGKRRDPTDRKMYRSTNTWPAC